MLLHIYVSPAATNAVFHPLVSISTVKRSPISRFMYHLEAQSSVIPPIPGMHSAMKVINMEVVSLDLNIKFPDLNDLRWFER